MSFIYHFGAGKAEGSAADKALLGGKGAGLAEMSRLGLPVPPGFTVTTEACQHFFKYGGQWPENLESDIAKAVSQLEQLTQKGFGSGQNPLLVSVRSGAPVSMPGMMDTILNLGLNDETVNAIATHSGHERFAWDAYRRFVRMFGDVVFNISHNKFACRGPHQARP